ncbi:MAG TPA: Crp/Fnr family transcriptional regulator [Steroidobacteraceae bacterium]|nr:Crp/Fnr family transcriptional regulator [Steroidobacteraceae bacterium]
MSSRTSARVSLLPANHASVEPQGRPRQIARYRPGQVIYREGAVATRLYTVRRGIAKLIRHLPNGRARIVRLQTAGSMIGLPPASITGRTYPYTAVAVGRLEAECLPHGYIDALCREQPERYFGLLEHLCRQVREADLWITEFSTGSIESRVARLIRYLATIEDEIPAAEVELLTCQDMGEILGVTPESVSRTVAEFKRRRVLSLAAKRPVERFACDLDALEDLARG